jgi:hypothetical protein
MTLQDFFISSLPTGGGNNQTKTMINDKQISDQLDNEKNRLKEQRLSRPSISIARSSIQKRIFF